MHGVRWSRGRLSEMISMDQLSVVTGVLLVSTLVVYLDDIRGVLRSLTGRGNTSGENSLEEEGRQGRQKGPDLLQEMIEALGDGEEEAVRKATTVLEGSRDPETIALLVRALRDSNEARAARAAQILLRSNDRSAVDPLYLYFNARAQSAPPAIRPQP